MAAAEDVKFSLEVMTNKEKTRVLFAEVDNDFVDVLLSFLTLPLGTVVRLLKKHYGDQAPALGSLNTLYDSLANLDNVHFWTEAGKLMLLNPRSSLEAEHHKLKLNIDDTEPTRYFMCEECKSVFGGRDIFLYYCPPKCHRCGKSLNEAFMTDSCITNNSVGDGVFTVKYNFLISDDLRIAPNLTESILETLSYLGITDIDGAEMMTVTVGFNGVMDLLKGSLFSRSPLTDLILNNREIYSATVKSEMDSILHNILEEAASTSIKITVSAMIQKSTNKLLFVQAKNKFVDFLLSLLSIPLGRVLSYFDGKISLQSLENLYGSIAYSDGMCLKNVDKLKYPKLPLKYGSNCQILALREQNRGLYYKKFDGKTHLSSSAGNGWLRAFVEDPKGSGNYVKGPQMFMITDDLKVTPLFMMSGLSVLNSLKIPLTDVEEQKIDIGMEEGLRILEASLFSTSALRNGLSHKLKKQTEQEH